MARVRTFSVGSIDLQLISDGLIAFEREIVFANVGAAELDQALADRVDEQGRVAISQDPLLIRSGGSLTLVDTGLGEYAAAYGGTAGHLRKWLRSAGITPEEIDLVILTHGHPDHIGGLTSEHDGERRPLFERAPHIIWASELDFWTSEDSLSQLPEGMAFPAREQLPPIQRAGLIQTIDEETEILPDVRLLPAPGHTPGHMVVEIESGQESFLYLADGVMHELNFEHPEWLSAVDMHPEQAVETRKWLLDRAIERRSLVAGFHLGRVGSVEAVDDRYRLV